jgi:hypothetical protein
VVRPTKRAARPPARRRRRSEEPKGRRRKRANLQRDKIKEPPFKRTGKRMTLELAKGKVSALPEVLAPDERSQPGRIERQQRSNEAAESRQGTVGDTEKPRK